MALAVLPSKWTWAVLEWAVEVGNAGSLTVRLAVAACGLQSQSHRVARRDSNVTVQCDKYVGMIMLADAVCTVHTLAMLQGFSVSVPVPQSQWYCFIVRPRVQHVVSVMGASSSD